MLYCCVVHLSTVLLLSFVVCYYLLFVICYLLFVICCCSGGGKELTCYCGREGGREGKTAKGDNFTLITIFTISNLDGHCCKQKITNIYLEPCNHTY